MKIFALLLFSVIAGLAQSTPPTVYSVAYVLSPQSAAFSAMTTPKPVFDPMLYVWCTVTANPPTVATGASVYYLATIVTSKTSFTLQIPYNAGAYSAIQTGLQAGDPLTSVTVQLMVSDSGTPATIIQ